MLVYTYPKTLNKSKFLFRILREELKYLGYEKSTSK